jgi:hypothetical protein
VSEGTRSSYLISLSTLGHEAALKPLR